MHPHDLGGGAYEPNTVSQFDVQPLAFWLIPSIFAYESPASASPSKQLGLFMLRLFHHTSTISPYEVGITV